jgi:hypothetical protein
MMLNRLSAWIATPEGDPLPEYEANQVGDNEVE